METIDIRGTVGLWKYKECTVDVGDSDRRGRCQVCGSAMRFAHRLIYPKELGRVRGTYENYIFVGIECAAELLPANECHIPRLAENETQRKARWRVRYENWGICRTSIDNLIDRGVL
jgi:hypothetical protein